MEGPCTAHCWTCVIVCSCSHPNDCVLQPDKDEQLASEPVVEVPASPQGDVPPHQRCPLCLSRCVSTGMLHDFAHAEGMQPHAGSLLVHVLLGQYASIRVPKSTSHTHTNTKRPCTCPSLTACRRKSPTASPCGHVFCWHCIAEWCQRKPECPLCRSPFGPSHLISLHHTDF